MTKLFKSAGATALGFLCSEKPSHQL